MNLKNLLLLTLILGLASTSVFAQEAEPVDAPAEETSPFPSPKEFNLWAIGINAGMVMGHTDMSPIDPNNGDKNFGYGLVVTKMFSHAFGIQGQLLKGALSDMHYIDSTTFTTNFFEHTINLVYNFGNISFLKSEPRISFQATLGLGLNHFKSSLFKKDGSEYDFYDPTEPSAIEIAYPAGLTMKYRLPKALTLELAYSLRAVNTDILDRLNVRSSGKDKYSYFSFGLSANMGKNEKDIDWVNPLNTLYEDMAVLREKMAGLGGDKDNDGVADLYDKDNETPEGVTVDGSGRAMDIDGDGVADYQDGDPFTEKGAVVDENGKAIDTDGDGVPDHRDLDNNSKPGQMVNFQGSAIAGMRTGGGGDDGSPTPVYTGGGGGGVGLLPSVYYAFNSANVEYAYYENLAEVANALKQNGGLKIKVTGYSDGSGPEKYNMELGTRRAQAAIDHLVKIYGVDASRLTADSKGEGEPLAQKGQSKVNRRVDFLVY